MSKIKNGSSGGAASCKTANDPTRPLGSWGNKLGIFVCGTIIINGAQIKDLLCNRIRKHSIRENTYDTCLKKKRRDLFFRIFLFSIFQFFSFSVLIDGQSFILVSFFRSHSLECLVNIKI